MLHTANCAPLVGAEHKTHVKVYITQQIAHGTPLSGGSKHRNIRRFI